LGHLSTQGLFPPSATAQRSFWWGSSQEKRWLQCPEVKGNALPLFHFSLRFHGFYEAYPSFLRT